MTVVSTGITDPERRCSGGRLLLESVEAWKQAVPIDIRTLSRYLDNQMIRNVRCPTCGKSTPDSSFCEFCGKALYSCKACGTTIAKAALFCPDCGKAVTQEGREMKARERVSWAWWLLPLLPLVMVTGSLDNIDYFWGGLLAASIGGVIAWAANRRRDPEKARSMLWFGLSLFIILALVSVIYTITD